MITSLFENTPFVLRIIFFLLLLYAFRQKRKVKKLKTQVQSSSQKTVETEQQKTDYKDKDEIIQNDILEHPRQYYYLKHSCMNKNESRMFYYINCALDDFFPNSSERNNYIVFPQVSMHAFIGIEKNLNKDALNKARTNLLAKNVDFTICTRYYEDKYYLYKPTLIIELDGSSHYSPAKFGVDALKRQQESDTFKNNLVSAYDIPMIRYPMSEADHITKEDRDKIKAMIQKYFIKE